MFSTSSVDATKEKMSQLAESFPSLKGKPGVRPWDNEILEAQLHEPWVTTGSRLAIQFVLSVWDPRRFEYDADDVRESCGVPTVHRPIGEHITPLMFKAQGEAGPIARPSSAFYLAHYSFNISAALQRWDASHVAAFFRWARSPWWP